MKRYSFAEINAKTTARINELGGKPINLYRILANQPDMLDAWLEFAYSLRLSAKTPRYLRELMILRTAQLQNSAYEWHQHRKMAHTVGVEEYQIAELPMWESSDAFNAKEKAVLGLTEAIVNGQVSETTHSAAAQHFTAAEMIELVMTASFYAMVPRVLNALDVPIEEE
ncbi:MULTISPECIES: carboxymuconolactone decarboxylase family protein [Legionella]|uniref:Carboxymuconolactone decarboxylase n=1 Tax=Legionella maceachernii TaxID=466 RepID=A0A0W0VWV3_9GAMM|nr:carboxymuconolactone decarboxylase family protein [Legionella maceachernii]KTD24536.1 carboxymuconolactone decarboxylase [Legionella maceachernii]SJZ61926.1 Alkylhydroperoxidase family enzyme, contains CxxC motif [Legionella maceachernii]SUP00935.1 Arsenate reductase and related proteins, glutaredoxin family [Legionella maceachernii]